MHDNKAKHKRLSALGLVRGVLLLFLAVGCLSAFAEPRILIVGDSWAQGIWVGGVMDKALAEAGFDSISSVGETTALGGTRAEQWVRLDFRKKILDALEAHPTVDTVHLVIGGNDVLGRIKETNIFKEWTEDKRVREWKTIAFNVRRIVTWCLELEQITHVVIGGYDYINAATADAVFALFDNPFHFGGMTQAQVNACFIEVERYKRDVALDVEGCTYVHNFGLLQHHFKDPADAPAPGGPPEYDPFPGGDPALPSPDAAFERVTLEGREFAGDGIHPSNAAHLILLRNAISCAYSPLFRVLPESAAIETSSPSSTLPHSGASHVNP